MIKDFCLFNADLEIPISIEYPVDIQKNVSQQELIKFINSPIKQGISWSYDSRKIVLSDPIVSVKGFPDTSLKYVVAVYIGRGNSHIPPNNAVIYNLDGTLHKELRIPKLLSKNILTSLEFLKLPNPPISFSMSHPGLQFNGFAWKLNGGGGLINVISILFDEEWWESRILNPVSGEIGELVDSGRL
jgi:hypothetical protein